VSAALGPPHLLFLHKPFADQSPWPGETPQAIPKPMASGRAIRPTVLLAP
jgi:hypothetical protein